MRSDPGDPQPSGPARDYSARDVRNFKVTVIGTINRDTLVFPSGLRKESFGGILYNLSSLSGLGGRYLEIRPVCNLGHDVYSQVMGMIESYSNVRPDGIRKVRRKNNHALLMIDEIGEREEVLQNRVPVLSFSHIEPFLDCDAVLVNFISGFDIGLGTLKRIRKKTHALLFMDVHSLTLGVKKDGRRFFRTPARWKEYVAEVDIVQCNLVELSILSGQDLKSTKDIRDFGETILSLGPRALLVTLAQAGAVVIYKKDSSRELRMSAGRKVQGFKDATGCGDAFSAGFLCCYLSTGRFDRSLDFGNMVAAEKCKVSGVEGVAKLLGSFATFWP